MIDRQVGRAVRERHMLHECGVGIDLRGSDIRVALLQRLFEALQRLVHFAGLGVALGRAAPDHHQALRPGSLFEIADVFAKLLGEIHLVLALLDVGTVDQLHVVVVEDRFPGLNGLQERPDLFQQLLFQHACFFCGGIHVVLEDVPAGEDQVIKVG